MKTIKLLLSVLIMVILTMSFINPADWYLCETSDYKILFPKKPVESIQTISSAIGELNLNLNIYEVPETETEDNLAYIVNKTEYPDSIVNSDKKDILVGFFRNSIDGAVKNVQGKLLSETKIELSGYPGREIRIDFQNGLAVIKMRLYLVKNKMFLLETISETKKGFNKSIDKFMNSFELIN